MPMLYLVYVHADLKFWNYLADCFAIKQLFLKFDKMTIPDKILFYEPQSLESLSDMSMHKSQNEIINKHCEASSW